MIIQSQIEAKLNEAFHPSHLEVINESNNHNVPPGSESHFKVVVVSDDFADKRLVARHQLVNKTLADELNGKIHALALHTFTPEEWDERNAQASASPPCLGGGKD